MNRLASALRLDVRLQQRYGFSYAAAFITLLWIVILRQFPPVALPLAVPLVVFVDLGVVGFYFLAGMVIFEKEEHTLAALVVSPLRFWEYLTAKLATLSLMAVVITLLVTVASYGPRFNLLPLVAGTLLMSLLTMLVSFILVAPYTSISRFLIPSQFYYLVLNVPLLSFAGWWDNPLLYAIPTQGTLLLLRATFEPIAAWQVVYSLLYQVLWIGGLAWLARRAFDRHIVARQGGV